LKGFPLYKKKQKSKNGTMEEGQNGGKTQGKETGRFLSEGGEKPLSRVELPKNSKAEGG